jgi:hypothetical protein
MKFLALLAFLVLACTTLGAADRPDFSGTWHVDAGSEQNEDLLPVIRIEQKDGELRISDASDKSSDQSVITCNVVGKECEGKLAGEPVKVSYWYNGTALVEMLHHGKNSDRIVKTRRSLSDDGQKMTVEVTRIVPSGKSPVKVVFVRQQEAAGENVAVTR